MASLKEAEQLAQDLDDLVEQLRSELTDGDVDFEKLASISDEISEHADGLAETFTNVNDALRQRLEQVRSGSGRSGRKQESKSESKAAASA
jgi:signal recognition particle GTPase